MAGIKITFPNQVNEQKSIELFSSLTNSYARGRASRGDNILIPQAQPKATAPWEKGLQVFEIIR